MSDTTPISAAALGTAYVAAQPVTASAVTSSTPDGATVHDAVHAPQDKYPILRHFEFGHLPDHLQQVSKVFKEVAHLMAANLPPGPETSAGLRKLLEAKDCAVRAAKT